MGCVVVTRGGAGDLWFFSSAREAALCPLTQLGDAYCDSPKSVAQMFATHEWASLAQKAGDPSLERAIRFTKTLTKEDVHSYTKRLWDLMQKNAEKPPRDPEELIRIIRRDRELTFKAPNTYRIPAGDDNKEKMKMEENKTQEKTSTRSVIAKDAVIRLGVDKNGVPYGPNNNPKRAGSAAAKRFEVYRDDMTVEEAVKAGATRGDINWDSKPEQGFIILS